ncbi:DUF5050 domain-containing protein [Wansuia hejianensis]|uniref:DUF5050 domain-containing protein n=1 Tax=Wansuia hejianensis TaxID=2763667 RepID=A0A926IH22_9FIRM|nr:DUF5050 domain-containing protein [Wansuia hejianensis]MBC8590187.1 DUF5050 domain-containing protein [Wansuia hejianensis]
MFKKRNLLLILLIIGSIFVSTNIYAETNNGDNSNVISSEIWFEKYNSSSIDNIKLLSNSLEEELYSKIYDGLINLEDNINIQSFNIPISKITDIYFKVLGDNPQIFYTGGLKYSYNLDSKIVINIYPKYIYDKTVIQSKTKELDNKVDKIISSVIKPNMSEFEKEKAIHDYIVLNTKYDQKNYENGTIPKDSYNAYGILVKGIGVCQGYSEAMKLLLDKIGIDCIVLAAPEMDHAWNIVTIDGKKYHVDATWNDPIPDRKGLVRYKYLNVCDEEMKKTHIWDYDKYPKCTSRDYSFLWDIDSSKSIENYIYYASNEKSKEYIYKFDLNTFKKEQITNVRAPYFEIAADWIYFSNYSKGGYLYKIKLDGTSLTLLNKVHSIDIYREGDYIYYTEYDTGLKRKFEIKVEKDSEIDEEDYTGYKKWEESLNVAPNKSWAIEFNLALDKNSINNKNVYIKDYYGNLLSDIYINSKDDFTIIATPTRNYNSGTYYLYIENLKSKTGKLLKENVKMKFSVK